MNKKILTGVAIIGAGYLGVRGYRKIVTAKDIEPKFQLPRNWKYAKLAVTFDLPFSILNTHNESISITGLGGRITYKGEKFTDFYLADGITIQPTSNSVFNSKCYIYLPDIVPTLVKIGKDISKQLTFDITGNYYVLGIPVPFESTVVLTFPSQIIASIKTLIK